MSGTKWTAVAIGLALWAIPAQAAAPAAYTVYKEMPLPLATCMARARTVVAAAGFGSITNGKFSVFGYQRDFTIVVRCMPEKQTVFTVVAGPDLPECDRLANKVTDEF